MTATQENQKVKLPVHKYVPPYKTTLPSREELHRCYGGKVYLSDFDTLKGGSPMNSRIVSDQRFDYFCKTYNANIKEEIENI